MKVLVTGATGYIGSRLVSALLEAGHEVVCVTRRAGFLQERFGSAVKLVVADLLSGNDLSGCFQGCDAAYYLVHSMAEGEKGFDERDRNCAINFARAAKAANVGRVIYLGGLGSPDAVLSHHLRSRQETGDVLRAFGPPTTEFRAAVVVGSGSLSFEIIRYLVERLPLMICPRWVVTRIQPIAIDDVISYLIAALVNPASASRIIEIGGGSVETYRSMMLKYAAVRGLRRRMFDVPILTPRLSSYWLDLFTPISPSISRPLIEGLRSEVVCRNDDARRIFPEIHPLTYDEAVRIASETPSLEGVAETRAHKSSSAPPSYRHLMTDEEGLIADIRERTVKATPATVFRVAEGIGGKQGWFFADSLWRLRAWIDAMLGGIGMSRSRRDPETLRAHDYVAFWRVERYEPGQNLLLRAEMKLPGQAWLQFETCPQGAASSMLRMTAFFRPLGLLGHLYWWVLYPVHLLIFAGMLRKIAKTAERAEVESRHAAAHVFDPA